MQRADVREGLVMHVMEAQLSPGNRLIVHNPTK